jgi:hypothetical protein
MVREANAHEWQEVLPGSQMTGLVRYVQQPQGCRFQLVA